MTDTAEPDSMPRAQFRRAWRIVTLAGLLGSVYFMVCLGGAPQVKFLTSMGATPFDFGLLAALGSFAYAFQLLAGVVINHMPRRKTAWISLYVVHRLLFVLVLMAPVLFLGQGARLWWIIGVLFVNNIMMQFGTPLWFSWMADLAPSDSFNVQWANRQRFIVACNIVASLLIGAFFHYFETRGEIRLGFTILSCFAIALGLADILLFCWVPEPATERAEGETAWDLIKRPLRDAEFRSYLVFGGYFNFAIQWAAPFFVLYMEESVKLNVMTVQTILTFSLIGQALTSRFWGVMCDTYGFRPVIQLIVLGKFLVPLTFLLTPPTPAIAAPVLALLMFEDGMLNSGMTLAMQGVRLKTTPRRYRAMYIGVYNFLSFGILGAISPLLSGSLVRHLGDFHRDVGSYHLTGFHVAFAMSAVLRALAVIPAIRLRERQSVPLKTVIAHLRSGNPVRVIRTIYRLKESPGQTERAEAARRLGELGSPLAIHDLIRSLKDESHAVRHAAATALGEIGVSDAAESLSAVAPLAVALSNPHSGIQLPAARALGMIGGPQSLKALLVNLSKLSAEALGETIDSLGAIGDSAAILPLICLFHDVQDTPLRRRIAMALDRLSEQTVSAPEIMALLGQTEGASPAMLPQRPT